MRKALAVIILTTTAWVSLFAEEIFPPPRENHSSIINKITIRLKTERMTLGHRAGFIIEFIILGKKYHWNGIKKSISQNTEIKTLFYSTRDNEIIKLFTQATKELNKYNLDYQICETIFNKLATKFNLFLEKSKENRKTIAKVLYPYLKKNLEKKRLKQKESQEIRAKFKDRKLVLIGINFGVTTSLGNTTSFNSGTEIQSLAGASFMYLKRKALSKFNYGFSFDLNFYKFQNIGKYEDYKISLANINTQFAVLIWSCSHKYRFYSSIGMTFNILPSSSKIQAVSGTVYEVKKFVYGGILELGFLMLFNNAKIALPFKLILKITNPQFINPVNASGFKSCNSYFGFSMSLMYNIK